MFKLVTTLHFEKQLRNFVHSHPDLKKKISESIRPLVTDPFQPRLRLHPLKGKLAGLYAVRITYAYRLTLTIKINEKEIILLDIGSHDAVYR